MIHLNNISKNNWNNTKISIIGAGKSGIAAAKLGKHIGSSIFISDINKSQKVKNSLNEFNHEVGLHSDEILNSDFIIKSPGIKNDIPIIQKCKNNNLPIISEIEFASWFTRSPIIALTGSNGKTTTTNLLHNMCLNDGRNSLIGGNIGIPFSENVLWELTNKIKSTVHVLELSSFQLENVNLFSPIISGILNISPDHMDRYSSYSEYINSKLNIARQTLSDGWIVYNKNDSTLYSQLKKYSNAIGFSTNSNSNSYLHLNKSEVYLGSKPNSEILFYLTDSKLKGKHNINNILAAATMAHKFGISKSAINKSVINFNPIEYRLEWIGNINNVDFFNDSKATNIAASRAAIESFDNNIIIILGGKDKGKSDFKLLIPSMKNRVKKIIAYGEAGENIKSQLFEEFNVTFIENFETAVKEAHIQSNSGDTILLSPACASFDQFDSFEKRGSEFNKIFNKLELLN